MATPRKRPLGRIHPAALLCALAVASLLGACSAFPPNITGDSSAPSARPSSTPHAPSAAGATSAPPAAAIDVCHLLPLGTVSDASGVDLSSSTPDPGSAAIGMFGCSFQSDGDSVPDLESQLDVTIYSGGPFTIQKLKAGLDASASADAPTVPVSGIGDEAYAGADGIVVKFGRHLIEVSGLPFDLSADHSKSQAVAAAFISAVGS